MQESPEAEQMRDRLAAIRENLARMRADSRASLARLAATREVADTRAATRARADDPDLSEPPPTA
jgi:hypothetical protein